MNRTHPLRLLTAAVVLALTLGCSDSPPKTDAPPKIIPPANETSPGEPGAAPKSHGKSGDEEQGAAGPVSPEPLPPSFSPEQAEAAIKQLGGVARLSGAGVQVVSLTDTLTVDEDLRMLSALPELKTLFLGNTRITDAGLAYLAPLKNLEKLSLSRDAISDAGLEHLVGLNKLKHLDLFHTPISDAGLEYVARLRELETLKLNDTNISDQGLRTLTGLTHLKQVWLKDTQATPAGIDKLKAAIPGLQVL